MKKTFVFLLILWACGLMLQAQMVVTPQSLERDYKLANKIIEQNGNQRQALELLENVRSYGYISKEDFEKAKKLVASSGPFMYVLVASLSPLEMEG